MNCYMENNQLPFFAYVKSYAKDPTSVGDLDNLHMLDLFVRLIVAILTSLYLIACNPAANMYNVTKFMTKSISGWMPTIHMLTCMYNVTKPTEMLHGGVYGHQLSQVIEKLTVSIKWIALQLLVLMSLDFEWVNHSSPTFFPRQTTQPAASIVGDLPNLTAGCTGHMSTHVSTQLLGMTMSITALKMLWPSLENSARREKFMFKCSGRSQCKSKTEVKCSLLSSQFIKFGGKTWHKLQTNSKAGLHYSSWFWQELTLSKWTNHLSPTFSTRWTTQPAASLTCEIPNLTAWCTGHMLTHTSVAGPDHIYYCTEAASAINWQFSKKRKVYVQVQQKVKMQI